MSRVKFRIFFLFLIVYNSVVCQSIRKNHKEMTQSEKDALVNAFYELDDGLVNDMAAFHGNNFGSIHFNLPSNPQDDVFFAWHRRQIFEVEQAMQDLNPKITIPFWDWTTDNTTSSDLWDFNFMGSFDSNWSLGRQFNTFYTLPTNADVTAAQAETNFLLYSNGVERGKVHVRGHTWVGGVMSQSNSPRDPIFYLHHAMVDKLWQDWVEANNITPSSDIYIKPLLPRYDGTYIFNGVTLPAVNPDDIVDSKALGVFFAENQLAELHDYTVNNTYNSQEVFYYQYTIEAKNNFIIPSGKDAKLESVNYVVLKPGFHAKKGAEFIAKIDADNDISTDNRISEWSLKTTKLTTDGFRIIDNVYLQESLNLEVKLIIYAEEKNKLGIEFKNECNSCEIEIIDSKSNALLSKVLSTGKKIDINLQELVSGTHSLEIRRNNTLIITKELIKL